MPKEIYKAIPTKQLDAYLKQLSDNGFKKLDAEVSFDAFLRKQSKSDQKNKHMRYTLPENLDGLDFRCADLSKIHFGDVKSCVETNFSRVDLINKQLSGVDFTNAICRGTDFSGSPLSKATFHGTKLRNAKFDRAI